MPDDQPTQNPPTEEELAEMYAYYFGPGGIYDGEEEEEPPF